MLEVPERHTPGGSTLRPRRCGPPSPTRSPGAVTFQRLTQAARAGAEAGRRRRHRLGPGGGAGSSARPEPPCNRRRPPGRAARAPGDPRRPRGAEDEDEGCAVELQITEGGAEVARCWLGDGCPGGRGRFMHWLGSFALLPPANLTDTKKVRREEDFSCSGAGHGRWTYPPASPPRRVLWACRAGTAWVVALDITPTLSRHSPPCLLGPALPGFASPRPGCSTLSTPPRCQHSCGLAAPPYPAV